MKSLLFLLIFLFNSILTQESYIDSTQIKNPKYSWKLSIVPGLGQLYNGNFHKSFFINSAFSIAFLEMKQKKNSINKRNTMAWWLFGIYVLGIIDAYVDAHLTSFPKIKNNKKI